MWISKSEYEELKSVADSNRRYADMFRQVVASITAGRNIIHTDFVVLNRETYDDITNQYSSAAGKIKDIEAELEWYKVKYHEMQINKHNIKTNF